jgi:hypothetical protein
MHRLIKKTFTSLNKIVTIVLFGNNVVLWGPEVNARKMKKNISITVHDTAMEKIILILYCLITGKAPSYGPWEFHLLIHYYRELLLFPYPFISNHVFSKLLYAAVDAAQINKQSATRNKYYHQRSY